MLLLKLLTIISSAVPLLVGLFYYRSLIREMKILVLYLSISFIFELSLFLLGLLGVNNLWMVQVWTIIEYIFIVVLFSYWLKESKIRKMLIYSTIPFIIFYIIDVALLSEINKFNSYSRSVESLIFSGVAGYALYDLSKAHTGSLWQNFRFYLVLAVFLYFTGSLMIFALSNLLIEYTSNLAKLLFMIPMILNLISYFLFAGGILCQVKTQNYCSR
jgi:hypothetical protein